MIDAARVLLENNGADSVLKMRVMFSARDSLTANALDEANHDD
jgi:hypothetical protein